LAWRWAIGLGFGLVGAIALAAETSVRLGFVDMPRILAESPQMQAARARIDARFRERNSELKRREAGLKALEDKLQRDALTMTKTESDALSKTIIGERRDVRRLRDSLSSEFKARSDEELNQVAADLNQAVREIAEVEGFDLVLSANVVYYSPKVDVTERVLERLRAADRAP
jgi:outer membrane protein